MQYAYSLFWERKTNGFLIKELVTNLLSIYTNNRLIFHEGGQISNQGDLFGENVNSLKDNSFGNNFFKGFPRVIGFSK